MLKLQPAPTFLAKVSIPVPGQEKPAVIGCTFAHMTRDQYQEFAFGQSAQDRSDVDTLMVILRDWSEIDAPFNRENVAALVDQYHRAAHSIAEAFAQALTQGRLGN